MGEILDRFISILPTERPKRYLVVVTEERRGDFVQTQVSQPLPMPAAQALAAIWSRQKGLEIR